MDDYQQYDMINGNDDNSSNCSGGRKPSGNGGGGYGSGCFVLLAIVGWICFLLTLGK